MTSAAKRAITLDLPPSRKEEKGGVWFDCSHKHELTGTAVFYQSLGLLQCNACGGYQHIKKPLS